MNDISMFGISAVEIAGPLLGCYFLSDIAMGMLGKAAPQLNILQFGSRAQNSRHTPSHYSRVPLIPGAHTLINHTLTDGVHAITRPPPQVVLASAPSITLPLFAGVGFSLARRKAQT